MRRPPESALVWYEDWRDGMLTQYWKQPSPETWGVWQDGWLGRPYSQLEGTGEIWLEHEGFGDIHICAAIAFPQGSRGRGGIMLGALWLCINMATQCLELWQGGSLLGSYQSSYANTPAGSLRGSQAGRHIFYGAVPGLACF
ncbi:MAG: hypothetical protein FWG10_14375 [Eubacteriaceae bacterium]|nr:hypothetical protein [Eubacteriaceae bacterium]